MGKVFHFDLFGKREYKYDFLTEKLFETIAYKELPNVAPNYFFVSKDFEEQKGYDNGIAVNELLAVNNVGIVTSRDSFVVDDNRISLEARIKDFFLINKEDIQKKYQLKENSSWKIDEAKQKSNAFDNASITKVSYRPFDEKFVYYNNHFIERSRTEVMQHFLKGENIGLVIGRQGQVVGSMPWNLSFITKSITDFNLYYRGGGMLFPLYLYHETTAQQNISQTADASTSSALGRTPNLNPEIVKQIADKLGLTFTNEKETTKNAFAPIDILDYIYAVLHSPTYREKYKEFLKIDFPRVPYPKDVKIFWQLVKLGGEIRQIHLLESPVVEKHITQYPINGNNAVDKIRFVTATPDINGKVYINDIQYFANVPEVAWNFYIGGYQPAQKWLKDRKGRKLEFDDIQHYQKIIVALTETDRLMKEINKIDAETPNGTEPGTR